MIQDLMRKEGFSTNYNYGILLRGFFFDPPFGIQCQANACAFSDPSVRRNIARFEATFTTLTTVSRFMMIDVFVDAV